MLPDTFDELWVILAYANRLRHDTNAACETEAFNDEELTHLPGRVLAFAKHS